MNTETIETYCVHCDNDIIANIYKIDETVHVRGEAIEYEAISLRCPNCGTAISDGRIENDNLKAAYAKYAQTHQIPLPSEISGLRKHYGLSLREFSKFLGFGEQTVARYERGALPDETHSYAIKQAQSPEGARTLLEKNRSKLSDKSIAHIECFIENNTPTDREYGIVSIPLSSFESRDPKKPCKTNGYRPFSFARTAALAQLLASQCANLFKTKFQKAMFFADMLSCEALGQSLTGLQYAHADHGPVVDGKDELDWRLLNTNVLRSDELGWGEVLSPGKTPAVADFNDDELRIISRVAEFVNSFTTANELSEYSHSLSAWQDTTNGRHIDYNAKHGEIENAIRMRLETG